MGEFWSDVWDELWDMRVGLALVSVWTVAVVCVICVIVGAAYGSVGGLIGSGEVWVAIGIAIGGAPFFIGGLIAAAEFASRKGWD